MKRKVFSICLALLALLCLFPGCDGEKSPAVAGTSLSVPRDLDRPGMVIGVPQGSGAMIAAEGFFKQAEVRYFSSCADGYTAVQQKKIDAFAFDRHNIDYALRQNAALARLPVELAEEHIVVGFPHGKEELRADVDRFIAAYRADGTHDEMYRRWFFDGAPVLPNIPAPSNPSRILTVATEGLCPPMNYFDPDGQLIGFDIEFALRLASYLDAGVKFVSLPFPALIPAVESGKADLLVASLNVTDERKERLLMSDDYIDTSISLMVHRDRLSPAAMEAVGISTVKDLSGKSVSYLSGSIFPQATSPFVDDVEYLAYNDNNLAVQAVRSGKADAFLTDEPIARLYVSRFPDELRVASIYAEDCYGYAFRKGDPLTDRVSGVIRELRRTGELEKMIAKWCGADDTKKVLGDWTQKEGFTGRNGTLRFAADAVMEPMCYMGADGQVVGLDIDLVSRIACELDMSFEYIPMSFGALIESLLSGKMNMVGGSMSITDERKEKVDFAETYYVGGMTIVAPVAKDASRAAGADPSQVAGARAGAGAWFARTGRGLATSFDRTFIRDDRWKLIVSGLEVTILITVFSALLGTLLAFGVCSLSRSANGWISSIGKGYVALLQGTPILVILMILYYVVFAKVDISAIIVAIIGFSLNFAAYVGEMLRTGIDGIPKGQLEAAEALGFTRLSAFRKVILPQVLRQILPVYRGEFVSMLKMTSVVGYIAIQDLTKMSDIIRSRTYEAFFPLIATAIIYFMAAHLLASFLTWLQRHYDPRRRRLSAKGKNLS